MGKIVLGVDLMDMKLPVLPYQYRSLPKQSSFRVLELLPSQEDTDIAYRLHDADWDAPLPYEAISYAWGDINIKVPTICDGLRLEVTPNLRNGLRRMRYVDRSRYLWADAVCIDQTNKAEQGHQVSNMRLIYQNATKVIVWLGEDEDNQAEKATQLIREIGIASCKRANVSLKQLKTIDDICNIPLLVYETDLTSGDDEGWKALTWFFRRPWFSRLWVFQEVNSGTEADMVCGIREIPWDLVALAANYLRARPEFSTKMGFTTGYYENACIMRRWRLHAQSTVLSLLNLTRNFITSNPLDKIYALMGMPPFMKMSPPLEVDYGRSKLELYRELAVRCILGADGLAVLGYVQHIDEVDRFPSWVPNWDRRDLAYMIDHPPSGVWAASAETFPVIQINITDSVLKATGILFDVIVAQENIDIWQWFDMYGVVLPRQPLSKLRQEKKTTPTTYITGEPAIEPHTMFSDRSGFRNGRESENRREFLAGFASYAALLLHLSKREEAEIRTLEESLPLKGVSYQIEPRTRSWDRSFFITEKGHMGLGSKVLQVGDLVCVLFGGRAPFTLRPMHEYFKLVGPAAYVHGIMEGEVIKQWEAGELKEQIFDIH
jgi:hypothetical protein